MSLPRNKPQAARPDRPPQVASRSPMCLPGASAPGAAPSQPTGRQIAHELANLLDGSLRNVGLVIDSLKPDASPHPGTAAPPSAQGPQVEDPEVVRRLEVANQALRQMGQLIHRWLGQSQPPAPGMAPFSGPWGLFQESRTLGQMIEETVRLFQPIAAEQGIAITVCVSDAAARLPAGPIYPILANALRNSLQAMGAGVAPSTPSPRRSERGEGGQALPDRVRGSGDAHDHPSHMVNPKSSSPARLTPCFALPVSGGQSSGARDDQPLASPTAHIDIIAIVDFDHVELCVRDDGPGLDPSLSDPQGRFRFGRSTRPGGHGLGLSLAREIVSGLGGALDLANRQPHGTILTARLPVDRLA